MAFEGTNYMIVNGATNASQRVLETATPLPVLGGTRYTFQGYAASVFPDAPAQLQFKVEYLDATAAVVNTATGMLMAPSVASGWQLLGFDSVAGVGSVSARISVLNMQTASGGNDFALDGLSFSTQPRSRARDDGRSRSRRARPPAPTPPRLNTIGLCPSDSSTRRWRRGRSSTPCCSPHSSSRRGSSSGSSCRGIRSCSWRGRSPLAQTV